MGVEYVTNPETGRKIKVGGDAFKKLTHAQQEIALGYGPKPKAVKAKTTKAKSPKPKKAVAKKPKDKEPELPKTPIGWANIPPSQVKKFLADVNTLDYSAIPDYTILIAYGRPVFDLTAAKVKKLKTIFWKEGGMFHVKKDSSQIFELVFGLVSQHISPKYDEGEVSAAGFEGWFQTGMLSHFFDTKNLVGNREKYVEFYVRYGGFLVKVGIVSDKGTNIPEARVIF